MKFVDTPLGGVFVVELERISDERGFFARTYCDADFRDLLPHVAQSSVSFTLKKGTLRGMHYQRAPHEEAKLVRCTRGAIFDVVVDLRRAQWFGAELTEENGRMLYVPPGFAHGFQSLADRSEVSYHISRAYEPAAAAGFRWNDPLFAIDWPIPPTVISERDQSWPDFVR